MEATTPTVTGSIEEASHGPSVDFIQAISEFLDTDPTDLLVELGYYEPAPVAETECEPLSAR
ncbi:MAG: hypothetical protein P4L33_13455 [Capsulimonadaceae bacterium]|nr:hypothetical protein [Capsulimonadaceae bacterium]